MSKANFRFMIYLLNVGPHTQREFHLRLLAALEQGHAHLPFAYVGQHRHCFKGAHPYALAFQGLDLPEAVFELYHQLLPLDGIEDRAHQ